MMAGPGDQGPWENPLLDIPRTVKEYADAQPGPTTELGPQTRTLLQVLTGAGSFEPE
jgi:hypothetical protein